MVKTMKRQRSDVVPTAATQSTASNTMKSNHSNSESRVSAVEVVTCAASFPISQNKRTKYNNIKSNNDNYDVSSRKDVASKGSYSNDKRKKDFANKSLDWNETVREVQKFGAQGWGVATVGSKYKKDDDADSNINMKMNSIIERKKFRAHQNEQYEQLTGRTKKQHAVPLPIVRGIKKKAMARERRIIQEARDAGIVVPTNNASFVTTQSKIRKEQDKKRQNYKMNDQYGPAPSIGFVKQGVFRVRGDRDGKTKK